jgi:signal transduction histidine kinase
MITRTVALAKRVSTEHPLLVDMAIAVAVTVVTMVFSAEFRPSGWRELGIPGYAVVALTSLPTIARRRAPMSVLLACCLASFVYTAVGYFPAANFYGSELALYTLGTIKPPRQAIPGAVIMAITLVYSGALTSDFSLWSLIIEAVVIATLLWKFGDHTRQLGERNRELATLTRQLEHEQADRARRAIADERVRIASELHDVVAHHMSVVSVQAGLAEYVFDAEPATARRALGTISTSTADALEEMRRLTQLLRLPPTLPDQDSPHGSVGNLSQPYDPAPGLRQLAELVNRVRSVGVPVDLTITGTQRTLPPGLELCAYRVIQESLTNVLKHAGPAQVTIELHYSPDVFRARISDNGRGPDADRDQPRNDRSGHGLSGMRERAKLYRGTVTAAARAEGGFEVELVLPLAASTAVDTDAV